MPDIEISHYFLSGILYVLYLIQWKKFATFLIFIRNNFRKIMAPNRLHEYSLRHKCTLKTNIHQFLTCIFQNTHSILVYTLHRYSRIYSHNLKNYCVISCFVHLSLNDIKFQSIQVSSHSQFHSNLPYLYQEGFSNWKSVPCMKV